MAPEELRLEAFVLLSDSRPAPTGSQKEKVSSSPWFSKAKWTTIRGQTAAKLESGAGSAHHLPYDDGLVAKARAVAGAVAIV
jgi:hypothetical protein